VISPRRTRLLRVRNLHDFRAAIVDLALPDPATSAGSPVTEDHQRRSQSCAVVPNLAAAENLRQTFKQRVTAAFSTSLPDLLGRDGLYDQLHSRLGLPPRRLSPFERDAIAQAATREAAADLGLRSEFQLRPGLVAEMLRFYDLLRRQGQLVARFEELLGQALEREVDLDRGARRMLQQTRLLGAAFRAYERRMADSGACDEHVLRERLLVEPSPVPLRSIIVTVADWIAEPNGLYPVDFDLLTRLPGLETIDLVVTDATLASGFHQRIHEWLPGLEEVEYKPKFVESRPTLTVPIETPDRPWFLSRDREEELIGIVRRLKANRGEELRQAGFQPRLLERIAVVYKRPLPYLYLAREVFRGAGVPYQTSDALPLAAEPFAAAIDLVLDFAASSFARAPLAALLRSPHFVFGDEGQSLGRESISALDRALSEARYLGGIESLSHFEAAWQTEPEKADVVRALKAAMKAAEQLVPLQTPAPTSRQITCLLSFLSAHGATGSGSDAPSEVPTEAAATTGDVGRATTSNSRRKRGQMAIVCTLEALAAASRAYDDEAIDAEALTALLRRAIEEQTFVPDPDAPRVGLHLVDDQAARYGEFDDITVVGLIDDEWPDRPRRNIFYPASLLSVLGWPSEKDRWAAVEARFVDLLGSSYKQVSLSTVTLDEEALVDVSPLLEEVPRAGLSTIAVERIPEGRMLVEESLSIDPVDTDHLDHAAREWAEVRLARSTAEDARFHGQTDQPQARPWSVSAIETYLACPFKFFAQHVLRLEEEPDDEEVMDPRSQGIFLHEVFEAFFKRWQDGGHEAITPETLDDARTVFEEVVEERLSDLSETDAALERTRLLGSSAAAGLGEAVLRMEAERPMGVVGRLLEFPLRGDFVFQTASGAREVSLNGKADRVDLLADGTFRVIDYKLGWPPNRNRALQLPIYSLCAQQRLSGRFGKNWTIGEAAYLAFKGPRRVVPLFSPADRDRVLGESQDRLIDAIDRITRGEFPPRPDDVYRCETCAFATVCRKDYVGDV
jgi:RecB family exonuclease